MMTLISFAVELFLLVLQFFFYWVAGAVLMATGEFSRTDVFYFLTITLTTIGYGNASAAFNQLLAFFFFHMHWIPFILVIE